jgi:cephalosporin hydroxylase
VKHPQHPEELKKLMEWADGSKSILEIGSKFGDTLREFAKIPSVERLVSVDLPGTWPWGQVGSEKRLQDAVSEISKTKECHLFLGNSQDPEVIDAVRALAPFDFIFIDGDHALEGVTWDWKNYGWMGKKVAFHDITPPPDGTRQELEVWKLWTEIKKTHITNEFFGAQTLMGIGLVEC